MDSGALIVMQTGALLFSSFLPHFILLRIYEVSKGWKFSYSNMIQEEA